MEYLLQHGADVHAKDDGGYFVILICQVFTIKFITYFRLLFIIEFGICALLHLLLRVVATYYVNNNY